MMDWTDRHCRYFHRLITPHALLYTEMVTTNALIHGDRKKILLYNTSEHPVALQLGGSDPGHLGQCAMHGEDAGYDEINLNCGCPSDRVQEGQFGACLMKDPARVAECVSAMRQAVQIPVTVKCRIGVDDCDDEAFLWRFVEEVSAAGCTKFIVHARKAWLKGLSPKENRTVPPLNHNLVCKLKRCFPELMIVINGGIENIEQTVQFLDILDGVMIGRAAYQTPFLLGDIEKNLFIKSNIRSRADILLEMKNYAQMQNTRYGTPVKSVTRHMMGLYHGLPGARKFRRVLNTAPHRSPDDFSVFDDAFAAMTEIEKVQA